jgi:2-oxo-4-hydroxy-4-carboxy--5-ureidoimidazoline (OHCU) decarboxylase
MKNRQTGTTETQIITELQKAFKEDFPNTWGKAITGHKPSGTIQEECGLDKITEKEFEEFSAKFDKDYNAEILFGKLENQTKEKFKNWIKE